MEVSHHRVCSSTASQQVGWVCHSLKKVWVLQHIIILPDRRQCHCVWRCLKGQFMVTWQEIKTHWISTGYDGFKEQFQPPEQQRLGSVADNAVAVVPGLKQGQAYHKKQLLKFWYRYTSVLFTASMFTVSMLESLQLSICESSDSAVISLYTLTESRLPVSVTGCPVCGQALLELTHLMKSVALTVNVSGGATDTWSVTMLTVQGQPAAVLFPCCLLLGWNGWIHLGNQAQFT